MAKKIELSQKELIELQVKLNKQEEKLAKREEKLAEKPVIKAPSKTERGLQVHWQNGTLRDQIEDAASNLEGEIRNDFLNALIEASRAILQP